MWIYIKFQENKKSYYSSDQRKQLFGIQFYYFLFVYLYFCNKKDIKFYK